jgi:flagellar motility protein MotE (MotC chaperone)
VLVLQHKATEAERLARELEAAAAVEEKRTTSLIDRLKDTHTVMSKALERQLQESVDACKRLEAYSKYDQYSNSDIIL